MLKNNYIVVYSIILCKRFIDKVRKVDGTNIDLKFKSKDIFKKDLFFIYKKRYSIDLYVIYDSSKQFTYILAGWSNLQYDAYIFISTNLYYHLLDYFSMEKYLLEDAIYTNILYLIGSYKSFYII